MKWIRKHIELKWGVLFVFVVTLTVGLISARMKSESEENELTPVFLHETEEKVWMPRAPLTDDVRSSLSFVIDSLCRITDPAHSLDSFWKSCTDWRQERHDDPDRSFGRFACAGRFLQRRGDAFVATNFR